MPVPYSVDLRRKVIEKVDTGLSPSEVGKIFNIDRSTIYDWLNVRKETGDIKPKSGYQIGYGQRITDLNKFKQFVDQHPIVPLLSRQEYLFSSSLLMQPLCYYYHHYIIGRHP